jgi:ribose transport system ATP-binding protein
MAFLEMRGISKHFPGVQALDNVDFEVERGEIHALVGENGAGKSTLMKVLMGVYSRDSGRILLDGKEVRISSPKEAENLGISMIFQEFNLLPHLTVGENIFLTRLPRKSFLRTVDWKKLWDNASEILSKLEISLDPKSLIKDLSVAEMQMVEIAKALSVNARILIMDEPTSALTQEEIKKLFAQMRKLKDQGVAIVFISHRLEEIKEISDRITVLRDGRKIATVAVGEVTEEEIAEMMVGREVKTLFPKMEVRKGKVLLEVKSLTRRGVFEDVSFYLREGEILGIYGLVGAGRTELVRSIFGEDPVDDGEVFLEGRKVSVKHPKDAVDLGVGLVPENRALQGLLLNMSVRENIALPNLAKLSRKGWVLGFRERSVVQRQVQVLGIKTPSTEQKVLYLSGGNQQKVVLAKWLERNPRVLILDEPTRGIDVGAKAEVHALMNSLAEKGIGIIMISSELPEVLGMSDRVLVMRKGRIVAEFTREEASPQKVVLAAAGGKA